LARTHSLHELPHDLPVPRDDVCDHLTVVILPAVILQSTGGGRVDLSKSKVPLAVSVCAHTGRPRQEPRGWNDNLAVATRRKAAPLGIIAPSLSLLGLRCSV
jgi:hypothetical protein